MIYNNPKEFKKDDFYKQLERRFQEYATVIPRPGDSGIMQHYLRVVRTNVQKIKNTVEQFDLIGDGFWGYGINLVSNTKEKCSNFDLVDIRKKDILNRHIHHDKFYFIIFKVKDNFFYVSTFGIQIGRSIIKSDNLFKIRLSEFKSASVFIDGVKMFVNFNLIDSPIAVSFQVDPYLHTANFAKYYIETMEGFINSNEESNKNKFNIGNITVHGGQVNIAEKIDKAVYNASFGISDKEFEELLVKLKEINQQQYNDLKNCFVQINKATNQDEKKSFSEKAKIFMKDLGIAFASSLTIDGLVYIGNSLLGVK